MSSVPVSGEPTEIECPSCKTRVVTRIEDKVTTKTHLIALLLCACLCCLCAWVPYCMDSCKNADHYCPSCGAFIGTYQR